MAKKYGVGSFFMDAVAIGFTPFTGGASLIASPSAHNLVGEVLGSIGGGGNDSELNSKLKEWEIKNEQWKTQMEAQKAELERLRKEREEDNKKMKKNNEEIDRLRTVINDPNKSEDEKIRARKQLVILEGENRKIKDNLKNLETKIKEKEQPLPAPNKPWSFPKFSAYDKLLIGAILTLLIYYLFFKEDKKK